MTAEVNKGTDTVTQVSSEDVSEDAPPVRFDPVEAERRLRPIRRLLHSWTRRGEVPPFGSANALRLAGPADPEWLPDSLKELHGEMLTALAAVEQDDSSAQTAFSILGRLDGMLGLPFRLRMPRPPAHGVVAWPKPETPPKEEAPKTEASSSGRRSRRSGRRTSDGDDAPRTERKPAPKAPPRLSLTMDLADADLGDEALVAALASAGVRTALDLIWRAPTGDTVLPEVVTAGEDVYGGRVAIAGQYVTRWSALSPEGERQDTVRLRGQGSVDIALRSPSMLRSHKEGDPLVLAVTADVNDTDQAPALADGVEAVAVGGHVHELDYGIADVDADGLAQLMQRALSRLQGLAEVPPKHVLQSFSLGTSIDALKHVHVAGTGRAAVRRRLAFDELIAVELGRQWTTRKRRSGGTAQSIQHGLCRTLEQTDRLSVPDEHAAIALEVIKRGLRSGQRMRQVLRTTPDRPSTDLAVRCLLLMAERRNQSLFLLPNAFRLSQCFSRWAGVLRDVGVMASCITGAPSRGEADAIARGETHVVFGTPEILGLGLEWKKLGFVASEASHPDPELIRWCDDYAAPGPDLLVHQSVPAPPEWAFTAFRDFDVQTLPPTGDAPAPVTLWPEPQREEAFAAAKSSSDAGVPTVLVFPLLREGGDLLSIVDARELANALKSTVFGEVRVALYHGEQAPGERQTVLQQLRQGQLDLLVATSPIEAEGPLGRPFHVLVEQADRVDPTRLARLQAFAGTFGQLHVVHGADADAQQLGVVKDLARNIPLASLMRRHLAAPTLADAGPETSQPQFRFAHPQADEDLAAAARNVVDAALHEDPALRSGKHVRLLSHHHLLWPMLCPDEESDIPRSRSGNSKRRRRRRRR